MQNFETADSIYYSSHNCIMESDCAEAPNYLIQEKSGTSNDEILQILSAISSKMITGQQALQAELQRVCEDNEKFKQEVRAELRPVSHSVPQIPPNVSSSLGSSPVIQPSAPISSSMLGGIPSSSISNDFQTQMLSLLNDTFSKLTTVITDSSVKSPDAKSDWIKFAGDPKKFRSWYLAVMAQLSIAPWQELYDSSMNSVVKNTTNTALNGKLYAKVIAALEGSALQHMLARKHLRANGILLLQELQQMYKPKCVPEVLAVKTAEFWSQMKRLSSESIDDYYNRFHELLEDINEDVETIPVKTAIRQFLFTLGVEFEPVQMSYRLGTLAPDWHTEDWPSLLVLCRDFYNSVNPKGPTAKRDRDCDRDHDPFAELQIERSSHHKKIRSWFMNPTKHKRDIDNEQCKYSGRCLYYLTKTHRTEDCHVKKECDKLLAAQRSGSVSGNSQTLYHKSHKVISDILLRMSLLMLLRKIRMSLVIILLMILTNLIYCTLPKFLSIIFI